TMVTNEEGDTGYVLTSKLEIEEVDVGPRTRALNLRARLGVTLVRQSVATPGAPATLPDNYSASSSSLTIAIGGTALYPYSKDYWVGGELAYDYDMAIPGISYQGQTTSFALHNLNLRALVGYDLHKPNGMIVFGRLGYHYESFQVSDYADFTQNTAKLPSQIISGPIVGAALAIPRFTKELGLRFSLDTILFGATRDQPKDLEEGAGPGERVVSRDARLPRLGTAKGGVKVPTDRGYPSTCLPGRPPPPLLRAPGETATSSGSDFNNTLSAGIAY